MPKVGEGRDQPFTRCLFLTNLHTFSGATSLLRTQSLSSEVHSWGWETRARAPNLAGRRGQRRFPGRVKRSCPDAQGRLLNNISEYHGQVLFSPVTMASNTLIFYFQVRGYLSSRPPTSIQHLTPRLLGKAQSPHFLLPASRPGNRQRRSQSFLQMELAQIVATLRARMWLTSSCWAEPTGRAVQWLMG